MMNLNCQMVLILCQIFCDYIEYIIKEHGKLTEISPIHVYIEELTIG